MNNAELDALQQALGHRFRDVRLLERALTHSSHAHEAGMEGEASGDNEQFEFLGDAVLGLVTSEFLFHKYSEKTEGQLSRLKAHLVSARHLEEVARSLGLGEYLRLGRGEERSGGRAKAALLVDALEALLAALYLDAGFEAARRFVTERVLAGELERLEKQEGATVIDHKSALQELLQAEGRPQPQYSVVAEHGPEHRKTFTVELIVPGSRGGREAFVTRATGPTKKKAEQEAARQALEMLRMQEQPQS